MFIKINIFKKYFKKLYKIKNILFLNYKNKIII